MKTTPRIKSNRIPLAIITALFAVSNVSSAKDCGEKYTGSIDIVECHDAELKSADKELNAVYNEAMKTRPAKEQQKLKAAQQAWLKYRDAGIAFMMVANEDMNLYGNIVVSDYRAKLTQKRVQELKHMLGGPEDPPVEW
jgi:uncharacterized protein YecT (DUF1311 family)